MSQQCSPTVFTSACGATHARTHTRTHARARTRAHTHCVTLCTDLCTEGQLLVAHGLPLPTLDIQRRHSDICAMSKIIPPYEV